MNHSWDISSELKSIIDSCLPLFSEIKNSTIFMSGGTGFIGAWLLETFKFANDHCGSNISVLVLTRNPNAFCEKYPHLGSHSNFKFIEGDVSTFECPIVDDLKFIIHAATDASADLNENNPLQMFHTIVFGTKKMLEVAKIYPSARFLFLSSGAVYGQQPKDIECVPETFLGAPDCINPRNTYAEAKRASELLCAIYQKQYGIKITIARIFALLGPLLNLNIHFAAGNFIRDALQGKKIVVSGDGRPERSYLYPTDLVACLLTLLVKGGTGEAYNVGSEQGISIAQLAKKVSELLGNTGYEILGLTDSGWNPGRYVPSSKKIANEFGLIQSVSIDEAILRTAWSNGFKG